ncbi:MAG: histidine kinase, partial [Acidaminobacteraceae bacterium]
LGHTMTASIMQMEVLELEIKHASKSASKNAKNIKETLRSGLNQVREVVEAFNSFDALDIETLIKDFSNTAGFDVVYEIDLIRKYESLMQTLYRATQESLTNSKRHGRATKAIIKIIENEEGVNFHFKDNGVVDPNWEVGFGLRSMRERFLDLNGYIEFSDEYGFVIDGFIPWEEADD